MIAGMKMCWMSGCFGRVVHTDRNFARIPGTVGNKNPDKRRSKTSFQLQYLRAWITVNAFRSALSRSKKLELQQVFSKIAE